MLGRRVGTWWAQSEFVRSIDGQVNHHHLMTDGARDMLTSLHMKPLLA